MTESTCEAVIALTAVLSRVPHSERLTAIAWLCKLQIERPDTIDHIGDEAIYALRRNREEAQR